MFERARARALSPQAYYGPHHAPHPARRHAQPPHRSPSSLPLRAPIYTGRSQHLFDGENFLGLRPGGLGCGGGQGSAQTVGGGMTGAGAHGVSSHSILVM